MLYYCRTCGRLFREEDLEEREEVIAEAWGRPITERYLLCPECAEEVEEYVEI